MRRYFFPIVFVLALTMAIVPPSAAQETITPYIFDSTRPISTELRTALDFWLAEDAPSPAPYYAVTYHRWDGLHTYVSLAAFMNEQSEWWSVNGNKKKWSITGDEMGENAPIWLGSVRVSGDWSVQLVTPDAQALYRNRKIPVFAMPVLGPGGGAYVRFPWDPGKVVQYGILGAHAVGFSQTGNWSGIDLVSGTDMGSSAASDAVYASVAGQIDYVCNDGQTVAVRISGGGDYFLYAHMLENATLVMDQNFSQGALLGNLKHGSFPNEGCGHAIQQATHYHLHWGVLRNAPSLDGGTFTAEGCVLSGAGGLAKWTCGNKTIKVLGFLAHDGNIGINPDTGTVGAHYTPGVEAPTFWDYMLIGLKDIVNTLFIGKLPGKDTQISQLINPILNGVKIIFRLTYVLIRGNLNLAPAVSVIGIAIAINLSLSVVMAVAYVVRILKSIPFVP